MRLDDFDFHLPDEAIAQYPAAERDLSRLLVLDRISGELAHRRFRDLPGLLRPGDTVVLNESRVLAARLRGCREETGGRVELLLVRPDGDGAWRAMGRPMRRLRAGTVLSFAEGRLRGLVTGRAGHDQVCVRFSDQSGEPADPTEAGEMPLPPYIHRELVEEDGERYQTVYARHAGSVAAPTAGLHFTAELLEDLAATGVGVERLILHVGPGTFAPVRADDPTQHRLDAEYYTLTPATAQRINHRRREGGRVVAVGTTVTRTLETCASEVGELAGASGWTELFIYPGYEFRAVDAMITNFHLPRTSLLMLVAALAGRERVLRAYAEAVEAGYRFYSYGDAMLIA